MSTKREKAVEVIRDVFLVAGAGLVAVGAGLVYRPAGLIVGGVLLLAAGIRGRVTR